MDEELFRTFVHDKLLQLLKFTDEICTKEEIRYSLAGGTLLGAVRHDGFIPWDDDADIVMTRECYTEFNAKCAKYFDEGDYAICDHDRVRGITFKQAPTFDGKAVDGLCVDIFILDNVPDDDRAFKKQVFGLKKLQGMMKKGKVDWKRYNLKGKILVFGTKLLGAFHSKKSILKKYSELSQKYGNEQTKRAFISNDLYAIFDIPYDKALLGDLELHRFETEQFPIFTHYDELLTTMYGDYMTPPPVEERKFLHTQLKFEE